MADALLTIFHYKNKINAINAIITKIHIQMRFRLQIELSPITNSQMRVHTHTHACVFKWNHQLHGTREQHDLSIMPTHSRTSSSASSVGSSYISSTDSNKTYNTDSPTPLQSNQHQIDVTNNFLNTNFHSINGNGASSLPRFHTTYNNIINESNDIKDHEPIITSNLAMMVADDVQVNEDKTDSLYGSIRTTNEPISNAENFTYKTLNGDMIRSVHPPGKGNSVNYKVGWHRA